MKLQLPCPNQTKLLEERLQKGKEAAARLQTLLLLELDNNNIGDSSAAAAQLALQILTSFTDSLSVLEPINEFCHQIAAADAPSTSTRGGSSSTYNRNNTKTTTVGDAVGNRKRNPTGVMKDRRGSYKRRNVSDSWVNLSSNMEDEYAWRKYGQKDILNSKFPRCYFRCTHKHDKGCKATKQVQRIIDQRDPLLLMYQTTYFGFHTCKTNMMSTVNLLPPPPAMPEYSSSSCLLSFQDESKDVIPIPGSCTQKNSSSSSSESTGETTNWLDELIMTTTTSSHEKVVLDDVVVSDDHHHYPNLDNNLNYNDFENDNDDDQYFFGDC